MDKVDELVLDYQGSVKNVYRSDFDSHHLWFQFTDDYSVFDWGKMPDKIANKGEALAQIGAYFFGRLKDGKNWESLKNSPHLKKFDQAFLKRQFDRDVFSNLMKAGLSSHFVGLVEKEEGGIRSHLMKVLAAEVKRPCAKIIDGQTVYFYESCHPSLYRNKRMLRLIPLEVIFRFGMGKGSSLLKRLEQDPAYAQILGLQKTPSEEVWFERPVVEFFTKLEPKDRHLSLQEAALMSGLSPEQFEVLSELTIDCALLLHHQFLEKGLELWDGKFEFVLLTDTDAEGKPFWRITLADSIGPDELRLVYKGKQLSKEFIRQHYRGSTWLQAIAKAQELAKLRPEADWKEISEKELGAKPDKLPLAIKKISDHLYGTLANRITGNELIPGQPSLEQLIAMLDTALSETKR